jgi:uncharacterized protein
MPGASKILSKEPPRRKYIKYSVYFLMPTSSTLQPLPSGQRLAIIDSLRGWALLGVVLMNYIGFYQPGKEYPKVLLWGCSIFFEAKSWTLLSFLFGFGFAVLMDKGMAKGALFIRRMGWLLVFAIINTAFYGGDILKDYAVLGMLLFLFRGCSARTSLWIGLGLLVLLPWIAQAVNGIPDGASMPERLRNMYYSHRIWDVWIRDLIVTWYGQIRATEYSITVHVVMLACFFLGMAAHKSGFFANLQQWRKILIRILLAGLCISSAIWLCGFLKPQVIDWIQVKLLADIRWSEPVVSAACIAAALCLLYLSGRLRRLFMAFQYVGRMTLTNYMTQNVLSFFLFSGAGFSLRHAGLPALFFLGLALLVYLLQVFFSRWWLTRYRYGPVEWVWRCLSYRRWLPLRY